jgi:hypothetical protein
MERGRRIQTGTRRHDGTLKQTVTTPAILRRTARDQTRGISVRAACLLEEGSWLEAAREGGAMKHAGMLAAVVLGCALSGPAMAAHGGGHSGGGHGGGHVAGSGGFHGGFRGHGGHAVFVGAPLFIGGYAGWPYYFDSYPPYADIPVAAPLYIENGAGEMPRPADASWYYCQNPPGYYPYVQQCPAGWQKVRPQAPPPGSY